MLLVCSRGWRRAGGLSVLFILFSSVQIVDIGGSPYIQDSFERGMLQFPDVLTTVLEVVSIGLRDMLLQMTG